ncbi:archaea-specific SMC-related protein [Haloarcula salinisoli]|uniref:ATPase n=1 Tax=Haloarcula salinisoli TaxID=2487746 RepID=A0A8J7YI93_9EURY|nr:archaea-specific SMC-related protein [Halomicroarcula salinisoli]MBX0288583.1 ATPase [Halomicroarcula salinisoli]MBX0306037.1 ATPase [Halomicroarcula salinisoli]
MWEFDICQIAGIYSGEATLRPGLNVIQASNWEGKSSLLTAIRTVLGGEIDTSTLTEGESEGAVTLTVTDADETYEVTLTRRGDRVVQSGEPYLTNDQDRLCAELFAFLHGENPIRTAVRNNNDLTPSLIRPLEEENIRAEIRSLQAEREDLQRELSTAEKAAKQLPAKTERISELEDERDQLESDIGDLEGDQETDGNQAELRESLKKARREREQFKKRVDRLEQKTSSITSQIQDKRATLEDLSVPSVQGLQADIEAKQAERQQLDSEIETLEALYNANESVLDGNHLNLVTEVGTQLTEDRLSCWICGSETTREDIEERMEALSEQILTRRDRRSELRNTIAELEDQQAEITRKQRRKDTLEQEISSLENKLTEDRAELETAQTELSELSERVESLEAKNQQQDDRQRELERELARTEAELETLREERQSLEEEATKRDTLSEQIESIDDDIESLRSRRERIIDEVIAAFDEALAEVVDMFDPSFETARLEKYTDAETGQTERLELVISRDSREITVEHLSEGEVELVGFMVALAGFEAFDVAERVPYILLDEVDGLASDNLHTLVTYLEGRTECLVTTAYPEAGDFDGHRISPGEWEVVSDSVEATT